MYLLLKYIWLKTDKMTITKVFYSLNIVSNDIISQK